MAKPDRRAPLYRRLLADITPLQESPAYRRVWVGGLLSGIGSQMTSVAVPIQVYRLTHSSLAVGAIGLALAAPLIVLGLIGGTFADAVDRRKLVLVTGSLMSVVSLLLAAQALLNLRQVWLLYVLIVLDSALVAVDAPARRTFMPRLVRPDLFPAASALGMLSFQVSMILGPLVAGTLIAVSGLTTVYLVDAASFLFPIYSVLRLPPMPAAGGGTSPGIGSVLEGLRFVVRQPILRAALLVDMNATFFGMPFALLPALAATRFGGGPRAVGLLYASPAIGGVLIGTFSGPLSRIRRQGLAVLVSVGVWGAAIACFGFSRSLWLGVLFLAIAGGADVINGVFRTTLLQVATPDVLLGRVNSVGYIVGAGVPQMGNLEAGVVAQLTSPMISAVSGGLACLVGVVILGLAVPAFARYDARDSA